MRKNYFFRAGARLLPFFHVFLVSAQEWKLVYEEDFSDIALPSNAQWVLDDYQEPFDTIMDDPGLWYVNDYGSAFTDALNSFHTYRKEFPLGTDGWLTASLSARDWDKDGLIEKEPILKVETINGKKVLTMEVDDHTGGAILRPTRALAAEYRIEYRLMILDFGGKRGGAIEYDNRINGYSADGCKTQHPWGEGSNSEGWTGDASVPYCEWQDVRRGRYGYNGFHFLSIVDFADPAPRNNHFWHYRRKIIMDSFSQHPDRVGDGTGGLVCNADTGELYSYRDSSFNTLNMWVGGLPGTWTPGPGGLAGNKQLFMTTCNGGVATRGLQSAAELQPEFMPDESYTFAIERNSSGYTLEASGNFARVGYKTMRFFRPFVVNNEPIWHYNVRPDEYNGRFNNNLKQENWAFGSMEWENQWPVGSAYPDFFVIGDLYTNVYEGKASLTDIKYFETDSSNENNRNERNCQYTILISTLQDISIGYHVFPQANIFLLQQVNGNLELYHGTPRHPDGLVWESGFDGVTDSSYTTTLRTNGNLETMRVDANGNSLSVWSNELYMPDGAYFFAFEKCEEGGENVQLFQGNPLYGGFPIWDASTPVESRPCKDEVLLESDDILYVGDSRQSSHFYIIQQANGNLEVRTGNPDNPGEVLWESGVDQTTENTYYTILQGDANLITWRDPVYEGDGRSVVWKTQSVYEIGYYTLVRECLMKGGGVGIYKGIPEDGSRSLWTAPPLFLTAVPGLDRSGPSEGLPGGLDTRFENTEAPQQSPSPDSDPDSDPDPYQGQTQSGATSLLEVILHMVWTLLLSICIYGQ